MRFLVLIFLVFGFWNSNNISFGQKATCEIKGNITNDTLGSSLDSVQVQLISFENNNVIESVYTGFNGKYKFKPVLASGTFKIMYSKKNYVSKFAVIDFNNINIEDVGSLPMVIDTRMDLGNDNDFYFLKYTPIAIARYNEKFDNIDWDKEYIKMIQNRIKEIKNKN